MSVSHKFLQPLDRVALTLMLVLSVFIGLLLLRGDGVAPQVRDFSWDGKAIGAEDTAFILNFSRPMDTVSVEENLQIDPPLPGKISWAGRRMAYTLLTPAPYGNSYQVNLHSAKDRLSVAENSPKVMQPFSSRFRTRDRAFVYLGVEGDEQGRLILYNLSQQQKTILTPRNLVVVDFKPYPDGKKVLFSATERSNNQDLLASQLYTVTTGINSDLIQSDRTFLGLRLPFVGNRANPEPVGKIDLILDNKNYQNLKFDLSADGQKIIVQRVNQQNPGEFGLWLLRNNEKPQRLNSQPGGDFMITPDSTSVAVAQGEGVGILPLQPDAEKPLDFLPEYGMVLSFSRDGTQATMVKFNSDYTRSLFLVTSQGEPTELVRTTGSIKSCQFDPLRQNLYCLLTQLLEKEEYEEQPYLVAIDLKTGNQKPLVILPEQRDVQMSLAPDGLAVLFDQVVTDAANSALTGPRTSDGAAITTSRLWLLPILSQTSSPQPFMQPEQLPLPGFHPRWLP
ncbi:hypothetical protein [Chroogloeocystis siderophila]|jgi:hypothetical protein|uniref:SbsA Ig-like domain-containing protein n=1 Tax=Chroogloeocystis siderophila 5.2 s.c.1 TaxID=247279 RepID=A0A1U7HU65_9CHRO|nr:hypothetical protein [Chroogloeocystis siderophila]OKH27126.1 hypothetical protein NIES1031_10490 [Chroogloeocystis siderophila 5.2 s.c.1]